MLSIESEVGSLSRLMEQEIAAYRQLEEAMTTESECVRKGQHDSLAEVVRTIEHHTADLRQIHDNIGSSMRALFEALGTKENDNTLSRLLSLLPPAHRGKLSSYQKTIIRLRERIRKTNEINRTFIRDNIDFLQHVISFLIHPAQGSSCYTGAGRSFPSVPSYALNREV